MKKRLPSKDQKCLLFLENSGDFADRFGEAFERGVLTFVFSFAGIANSAVAAVITGAAAFTLLHAEENAVANVDVAVLKDAVTVAAATAVDFIDSGGVCPELRQLSHSFG